MFWKMSALRTPVMYMHQATRFVQASRSPAVWKMTVALPVVPDEECMRTSSSRGTARNP